MYLGIPDAGQPPKRLVAFRKVWLDAGASERVTLRISESDTHHPLSVWRPGAGWVVPSGTHRIYVGTSSEDIASEVALES